jgi:iron complex outermembrane receptor protein
VKKWNRRKVLEQRKITLRYWTIVLFFYFCASFFGKTPPAANAAQQEKWGKITGRVTDAETGAPVVGANLLINRTLLGGSSDVRGRFTIRRIPAGLYDLRASCLGYRNEVVRIKVQGDSTSAIAIALQPTVIPFEQVIVTGSRQQEDLQRAANSVSVISPGEIRRRNRNRIDESLQSIAGVTLIGENVNVRGGSGYTFLGLGASRVLMLIDDVPVLTSDLGRANWDILPVTEVERVEVLKGAASVLYGSGGISGVVNVITKPPAVRPTFGFRQSVGLYDDPSVSEWRWTDRTLHTSRTDLSYSDTFHRLGIRLAVSRHTSTSDRENGDFQRWYFTGKAVYTFPDASNLSLFATYSRDARGFFVQWVDQDHALKTILKDRIDVNGFAVSLIYNKLFSPKFSTKLRLSSNSQLIGLPEELSKDFKPALGPSAEAQANWLPHKDHNVLFGVDYKREDAESKYYGVRQANAISPYVQNIWKVSGIWQLSAGVRYDRYVLVGDSAETQLSPKAGASYNIFPGSILHFSAGRGFRAPSIAERFTMTPSDANFRFEGNPNLKPERSTLIDLGLRQRIGENFSAEITVFSNKYENLIELIPLRGEFGGQLKNYPPVRIRGLEAEVRSRWWKNRLGLEAALSWMQARSLADDEATGLKKDGPLPYRPKFTAFVSPSLSLGPATIELDYRYAARYAKVALFPLEERVPQEVVDARLIYRWRKFTFQLSVKNAINYNYTVVERILSEIRNFSFSIYGEF